MNQFSTAGEAKLPHPVATFRNDEAFPSLEGAGQEGRRLLREHEDPSSRLRDEGVGI